MKISISIAIISFLLLNSCNENFDSPLSVSQIKCNGIENPVGTEKVPVFSWIIKSPERRQIQTAYQIIVSSDRKINKKKTGDIWDTG